MTKSELLAKLAESTQLPITQLSKVLDSLATVIVKSLQDGDEVTIPNIGKIAAKQRAARTGINPATKESISIPASVVPTFKASKQLKDALNK